MRRFGLSPSSGMAISLKRRIFKFFSEFTYFALGSLINSLKLKRSILSFENFTLQHEFELSLMKTKNTSERIISSGPVIKCCTNRFHWKLQIFLKSVDEATQ